MSRIYVFQNKNWLRNAAVLKQDNVLKTHGKKNKLALWCFEIRRDVPNWSATTVQPLT